MSRVTKRFRGLVAEPDPSEDSDFFDPVDEPEPDVEANPPRLSAKAAIAQATFQHVLPRRIQCALEREDPVVVLIETQNNAWSGVLAEAAHGFARGAIVVSPLKAPGRFDEPEAPAITRPTFVISSDPAWLAPALVAAADLRVRVKLTPAIVRTALKLAMGRRARVEARDIVGLDILDVASAIRPGESAAKAVRRMRGAARSRSAPAISGDVPRLDDLVGYGPASAVVRSIADDVARMVAGELDGAALPSCLLHGVPGTGKTMIARSFAVSVGLPLIQTSVADWFSTSSGHLGDVIVAAQRAFDQAAASSPSILFIDELDALPDRATMDNRARDWWLPVVTGLLLMIDRIRSKGSGVVLIGATNYKDRLDAALRRPGRFDRHVEVTPPRTAEELAAVLRHHLRGALPGTDLVDIAQLGLGATGAQAEDWVRQAEEIARREDRPIVLGDLAAAMAPPDPRSERERRAAAIHESGHAIVGRVLGQKPVSISIIESAITGGVTTFAPPPAVLARDDLERQATIGLGGRAADELLSGSATTGAADDLRQVTQILAGVHASFGLGDTLASRAAFDMAGDLAARDPAVRRLVEDDLGRLMKTARSIVQRHRSEIETLAAWLMVHRFASGADVETLLSGSSAVSAEEPSSADLLPAGS